ncbi:MAG: flagellar biosynthetic protein FliR [Deltaproteobacteria bacterium RBG_13_52_11b]|nr:MAG: flagellar biosynthetic protein FliR [Deltaproteobacteria bacterium RBG_13_52_11b]
MDANMLAWSVHQFQLFLLIVMRVAFILFMMPLLGTRNVPVLAKAGLTLTTSLILLPVVPIHPAYFPSEPLHFLFFMVFECLIGFILGLSIKVFFAAIQLAGEFIGFQMGLSMAQVVDPSSGMDATLVAQLYYFLALLVFLSVNGHHWFFRAVVQSFRLLPPGTLDLQDGLYRYFLSLSGKMFIIGIKIAAPIMAVLFLAQVAMGIIAKMVPQINILITSFPITIGLGMIFIGLSLELLVPYVRGLSDESGKGMIHVLIPLMAR